MTPGTTNTENEHKSHSAAWIAAGVGAGIGVAVLAYRSRPRSRWDRATDVASDLIETAGKQVKPWMGAAAGTAAVGTAVALYMARSKESGWERSRRRAGEMASQVGGHVTDPWANVAATAAISLLSIAYTNKARRRTLRGADASTADRINALTEKGVDLLRRFRNISEQTGKLYARGRHAIA
jgi:hypothetical protein